MDGAHPTRTSLTVSAIGLAGESKQRARSDPDGPELGNESGQEPMASFAEKPEARPALWQRCLDRAHGKEPDPGNNPPPNWPTTQ